MNEADNGFAVCTTYTPRFFQRDVLRKERYCTIKVSQTEVEACTDIAYLGNHTCFNRCVHVGYQIHLFKEHVAGLYASVKVFPFILEDVERGSSHTFANGTLVVHTATVVSIVTQTFIAPHTACIVHLAVSHVHHILGFGGGSPIRVIRKFVCRCVLHLVATAKHQNSHSGKSYIFS